MKTRPHSNNTEEQLSPERHPGRRRWPRKKPRNSWEAKSSTEWKLCNLCFCQLSLSFALLVCFVLLLVLRDINCDQPLSVFYFVFILFLPLTCRGFYIFWGSQSSEFYWIPFSLLGLVQQKGLPSGADSFSWSSIHPEVLDFNHSCRGDSQGGSANCDGVFRFVGVELPYRSRRE